MRLAIIGAKGQVGWELSQRAPAFGHAVLAWDVDTLDITDANAVDEALASSDAHAVINAAAYTAVDKAEQEPALAFAVNRDGPAHLAAACARLRIPLLHISTDYVYDGAKIDPYVEDDPTTPLGVYGASKLAGDETVRQLLPRHLILRVSWVFGVHGHNFVKTILRLAREREELRVVADQRGCPTFAGDIADTLLELAGRIAETVQVKISAMPATPLGGPITIAGNRRPPGMASPAPSSKACAPADRCRRAPSSPSPPPSIRCPPRGRSIRCWIAPS